MSLTFDEFVDLATDHTVVPVWRKLLSDLTTPIGIFLRCVRNERGFLLESVEDDATANRYSFVGRRAKATLVSRGRNVEVEGALPVSDTPLDQGILAAVNHLVSNLKAPKNIDLPPLNSGLVGFWGYETIDEIENIGLASGEGVSPTSVVSLIGDLAVFDHWTQQVTLISAAYIPSGASREELRSLYDSACTSLDLFAADGATPISEPLVHPPKDGGVCEYSPVSSTDQYCQAVEKAKEYIAKGDIFQVVLSKRFRISDPAEPLDVYRVLRQTNPSPYMYYLQNEELSLVGCSPEALVRVADGRVTSRPIAGTRPRGATPDEDEALAKCLEADPKEIAEHVMLVDLARNDVGRVCEFGSLEVDQTMELERYSHVMHLTSQVSGTLSADKSVVEVFKATFPAGTVSGAPKVRAMELISELEPISRGPYAGVVGYFDFSGNMDTAITIRTMFWDQSGCYVQAGAGIVSDSQPEAEDAECFNKAKVLLAAVTGARQMFSRTESK